MLPVASFNGVVEFSPGFAPRPGVTHVIFDFDGTLSWLRHGWPEIMLELFRRQFPARADESEAALRELLLGDILSLNGKPTIFQCQSFSDRVRERGGPVLDPEQLRQEYQSRLDAAIARRTQAIRGGAKQQDDYVVHGARPLLEKLKRGGLTAIILSSTIEERVKEEAELLGLTGFFGRHIYGGTADPRLFSKRAVIDRLLREECLTGENVLSFGDGPVEIRDTKAVGGLAIAVASDENHNGSGVMDAFKRRQLLDAGADVAIADFRDAGTLLDLILRR